MPQVAPTNYFQGLTTVPTALSSAELAKMRAEVRTGAFFSARIEDVHYLDGLRQFVQQGIDEGLTEGEFIYRVRAWLESNAHSLGEDYTAPSVRLDEWKREEVVKYERSVRNIDSLARLRLIFRTQAEMCAGVTEWRRGMEDEQVQLFPAWRFIRRPGAKTFRADHVEHEDAVRLKTDLAFWIARNNPEFGGFGNPWPPFGFNSWMWIVPVSRSECESLGLLRAGQKVKSLPKKAREKWLNRVDAVTGVIRGLTQQPPDPQEPEKPAPLKSYLDKYVPSSTREEAIERSKLLCNYPDEVYFDKEITKAQIDEFNETVERLYLKYDVDKLDKMQSGYAKEGVGAWVGGSRNGNNTITLNNDNATGGVHGLERCKPYDLQKIQEIIQNLEQKARDTENSWYAKYYLDEAKKLRDRAAYGRHNVGSTPDGIDLRSLVIHEFGHIIQFRAYDSNRYSELYNIIMSAKRKAMRANKQGHRDMHFLSEYAKKNEWEFFAEAFNAREHNEPLPGYINDMLDEVINVARTVSVN